MNKTKRQELIRDLEKERRLLVAEIETANDPEYSKLARARIVEINKALFPLKKSFENANKQIKLGRFNVVPGASTPKGKLPVTRLLSKDHELYSMYFNEDGSRKPEPKMEVELPEEITKNV